MQEETELQCPHCSSKILKASDNDVKMRVKLIRWDKGGMFAVCKSCTGDVRVDEDILKSIRSRFVYEVDATKKMLPNKDN